MIEADFENNNADAEVDIEMNDPVVTFSAVMTQCNVDNTSHGAV